MLKPAFDPGHPAPSSFSAEAFPTRLALATFALCVALGASAPASAADGDIEWNDSEIAWVAYTDGLRAAAAADKPVAMVVYADWCGQSRRYSDIFRDPRVVELSHKFVMVRVDQEDDSATAAKFAPDGGYVPRTFFLTSGGELRPEIHEVRDTYKHFFHPSDPNGLIAGMKRALGD